MAILFFAALWGFAEATLFFFVPDLLLSFLALSRLRLALLAALIVTAGAMLGGLLMFGWGQRAPESVERVLDHIPAISASMIEDVRHELADEGYAAMVRGAFRGRPFKVYAAESGVLDSSPLGFAAMSWVARLPRFALIVLFVHLLGARLGSRLPIRRRRGMVAGLWALFYALYFTLTPW